MRRSILLAPLTALLLAPGEANAGKRYALDRTKPAAVVKTVFYAAKTGDTQHLRTLCDPQGKNDGDTRRICTARPGQRGWKQFAKWFAKARVSGRTSYRGSEARVPILFGPKATKPETFVLIKRGRFWYLYGL